MNAGAAERSGRCSGIDQPFVQLATRVGKAITPDGTLQAH
jgi:hypothetical protein